jgi:hypothetical protein
LFCSDDYRSWPRDEKINNHWCTHTFLTMIIEESVCFMSCEPFFGGAIILMWYTRNIFLLASDIFFINWTVHMSDNLPERVQILGHAHIICITVRENRIICCQIFCDLLLKSAFERNFNVMQLILVKIKWHIKWKYSIQKFHDIYLSYYVKIKNNELTAFHAIHFMQYSIGSWLSRWMWYATNICYDRFWWCCLHILFLILLMALHSKCLHS